MPQLCSKEKKLKRSIVRLAGIPLYIHWSFWLLIIWIVISNVRKGTDAVHIGWSLVFIALIFVCVVLHELGHALTARRFGIGTKSIVLLPIGGVANIEKIPDNPKQELWITVMGPAVNLLLALILFPFIHADITNAAQLEELAIVSSRTLVFNVFAVNVFMLLFNLIPAFPMDGGRILRATAAFFTSWKKATRIATIVGNLIAVVFIVAGVLNMNLMLSLIGLFVIFAAQSELRYATTKSVLEHFKVKDALITNYYQLSSHDPLNEAARLLLSTQSKKFVVIDQGSPAGIIGHEQIIKALAEGNAAAPVSAYMQTNLSKTEAEESLQKVYDQLMRSEESTMIVETNGQFAGIIDLENIRELIALQAGNDG